MFGGSEVGPRFRREVNGSVFAQGKNIQSEILTGKWSKSLQPDFEPCNEANLKIPRLGKNFARAVRADAFVAGNVGSGDPYTVTTDVSDAFELFDRPESTMSRNVDIDNPAVAILKPETHAAVLGSVAAGLAAKDCENALAVISVARRIVKDAPEYLSVLQHKCQDQLPNIGLLGSNP